MAFTTGDCISPYLGLCSAFCKYPGFLAVCLNTRVCGVQSSLTLLKEFSAALCSKLVWSVSLGNPKPCCAFAKGQHDESHGVFLLLSFLQLRSALDKTEELEVSNGHLVKRLEKMKANRSALLSQQ